jgi:hypothetical protein
MVPFDPEDPPCEPPPGLPQPMLWRLARRLYDDHEPAELAPQRAGPACRTCGDPWPCRGRRLAERGLVAACLPARSRPARGRYGAPRRLTGPERPG